MKRSAFFLFMILMASTMIFPEKSLAQNELKIAFSRCSGSKSYQRYVDWIHHADSKVKCFDLYHLSFDIALKVLEQCDGLILTGGPDVNPGRYGNAFDTVRCQIDDKRDTLEFALIEHAKNLKMPVFGICRGLQILNVAYGGSLIVDIPEDVGKKVIHRNTRDSCFHKIEIDSTSQLFTLTKVKTGMVNSSHHQAIKSLAPLFRISASAEDGIPEAIEWKSPVGHPYLLAVQWHPEKLDFSNKFSAGLLKTFLLKAGDYQDNVKGK